MKGNIISNNPTRTQILVYSALFLALSVVLKLIFEIYIPLGGLPSLRINLTMIPLFLSGIVLGPLPGFIIGILSDLLCYIVKPNGPLFLGFTISSGLAGLIPGYLWVVLKNRPTKWLRWVNITLAFIAGTYLLSSGALVFDKMTPYFMGEPVNIWLFYLVVFLIIFFAAFPFISHLILKKNQAQVDDSILFIVTVEQLINSVILNTIWLVLLYGQAWTVLLPARIISNIFIVPIYSIILAFLVNLFLPKQKVRSNEK